MKLYTGGLIALLFAFLVSITSISHSQVSAIQVGSFEMTSNGNGLIPVVVGFDVTAPPTGYGAYSADWYRDVLQGGGSILSLPTGMQAAGGWYFVVAGPNTIIDFASAVDRWTRNGLRDGIIAGNSYEIRFTATGGKAIMAFTTTTLVDVPFELWYLADTPGDPSDDVRMVPWLFDEDANDAFTFQLDHQASGANNDPYSDWIYLVMPADDSPGQAGYDQFVLDATGGTYLFDGQEHLARVVLMNWNQHQNESFPGAGDGPVNAFPETGTTFRLFFNSLGSYDIYTVNVKSGNVERVTQIDDADEYNPSFSNNGKKVAHDLRGGSAPLGHSIYVTDVNTGVSTLLDGAEGGNDASWSPNGEYIAFDRTPVGDLSIYIVPAAGGTPTLVRADAVDAEWSNNSKRLVFHDITDGSLRTVDKTGGSETNLGVAGINPSWSPNGKAIAYSDGNNIFTIEVKESGKPQGTPVQLTNDGSGVFNQQPSWSNNSKTVVFHSNRVSGDFDLWTVSASGGTPSLLTGDPDNGDYDPCYSKNGKYVAYAGFTDPNLSAAPYGEEASNAESNAQTPETFALEQNYPNPFNPTTQIRFSIPEASNVSLRIYNNTGQMIKTLVSGYLDVGYHSFQWDATNDNGQEVAAGVYLYRITTGSFIQTRKMILMK